MKSLLLLLFACTAACGSAFAQVEAGEAAPSFEGEWLQHPPTSLEKLRGRVVLIEFFRLKSFEFEDEEDEADHTKRLKDAHRKMRKLHEKYASKGLVVLGVTSSNKKEVEESIVDWKMTYPIVLVADSVIAEDYGLKSTPRVFLVNQAGTIDWRGSKYEIDEENIVALLKGATIIPPLSLFGADRLADDVNKHLRFESLALGKAHRAVAKALVKIGQADDLVRCMSDIEALFQIRSDEAEELRAGQDFYVASLIYEELQRSFAGSDLATRAKEEKAEMLRNKLAKLDIRAGKVLAEGHEYRAQGFDDKAAKKYEAVLRNFPETKSAQRAQLALAELGR